MRYDRSKIDGRDSEFYRSLEWEEVEDGRGRFGREEILFGF